MITYVFETFVWTREKEEFGLPWLRSVSMINALHYPIILICPGFNCDHCHCSLSAVLNLTEPLTYLALCCVVNAVQSAHCQTTSGAIS